jgi:hypothetical protein
MSFFRTIDPPQALFFKSIRPPRAIFGTALTTTCCVAKILQETVKRKKTTPGIEKRNHQ